MVYVPSSPLPISFYIFHPLPFKKKLFTLLFSVLWCVCVVEVCGVWYDTLVSVLPELEGQVVASCLTWVLGTELGALHC